jgi:alpha,alpha-trehalose phosphorylase
MIKQSAYGTEPWRLVEKQLDLDLLAQSESIFALSNGHIGLRGNLDEGDPHGLPGSYLNSVYEVRPLPYAEAGYGFPDDGQTAINVTNGKIIRLLVEDEPFDIRYGTLHSHERVLDLRAGTLTRQVDWSSPAGARIKVTSVRMVSLTQRAIAAISYTVEPVDQKLRLVLQSELVANEELPPAGKDPRLSAILQSPLVSEAHELYDGTPSRALLVHKTRVSGLRIAAGMSHEISGPARMACRTETFPDLGRVTMAAQMAPGEQLHIVKYLGYGWSSVRSRPALIDQVVGALAAAHLTGWDGLLAEQRDYLDEFWEGADVELDGDAEIQQAVRFGLFHILQAAARAEFRPIAAKGLTGTGYDVLGHRDLRVAGTHLHPSVRRGRRAALAAHGAAGSQAARGRSRPGRGRVPVADDPRPGVLGLLARRDGRVPHQRGHRRRGQPLPGCHRGRGPRDRGRPGAAGGDRAAVALARPARRQGPVQDRGRDRAG